MKKMRRLLCAFPLIALILVQCGQQAGHKGAAISFYYWRTVFELSDVERQAIADNHVDRLYVRYFDISEQHGQPVPVSAVEFRAATGGTSIVPVIFIRNEVMLLPHLNTADLAGRVGDYLEQINSSAGIRCSEIQVDCDWTLNSREVFFRFINDLRRKTNFMISATIRLHQVKYFQTTGVPPVDRGMLMYYNMGHISADSTHSIYDRSVAARYVESLDKYPLPLDVALPIFSWGMHIRGKQVIGLLPKVDKAIFSSDPIFNSAGSGSFVAIRNGNRQGRYFQQGDRVKIESITVDELNEMASDLSAHLKVSPLHVVLFDLDEFNLQHFSNEKGFTSICASF